MRFKNFYLRENDDSFSLKTLDSLVSISKKVKYAKENLKKMGEGSSRIVFDYDDKSVLKLAKNSKGIAQNDSDGDYGKHRMYPEVIPEIFDKDDDGNWILVRKANKITTSRFKQLTNIDFKTFCGIVRELEMRHNNKIKKLSQEAQDHIDNEDSIIYSIYDLMGNYNMLSGDICKINSWGEINNKAVLIDSGLTDDVYKTHYRKK